MNRLLLLICVLAGAIFAEEPPKQMTKIEVVLQSPDAPAGSFAAKPKMFYRAGNRYCRVEEAPGRCVSHRPHNLEVNVLQLVEHRPGGVEELESNIVVLRPFLQEQ
jgi:hypothetical protein